MGNDKKVVKLELEPGRVTHTKAFVRILLGDHAPDVIESSLEIPSLEEEVARARHWLGKYLLNTTFRGKFEGAVHALCLALIRRAQHAFRHYAEGRKRTLEFAAWDYKGAIPGSAYFGAVEGFENTILQLQMMMALMRKLSPQGGPLFEPADGSETCQLSSVEFG